MTSEIQTARADQASVPLDPFKVKEAVQMEIASRLEKVIGLLDMTLDWAHSTRNLAEAETKALNETRNTITEVLTTFQDRANAAVPELMPGRG